MPKIEFKKNSIKTIHLHGSEGKSLMEILVANNLPVASSCGGEGICSKCHVEVISGKESLSKEENLEALTKRKNKIHEQRRLSCQCKILGDVTIDTDYW